MKKITGQFVRIAALACVISGFVVTSGHAQKPAATPVPPVATTPKDTIKLLMQAHDSELFAAVAATAGTVAAVAAGL